MTSGGHQRHEAGEVVVGIVGAGTGLRVILHAEDRLVPHFQTRHGAVVEVVVGDPHPLLGQGGGVKGKTVVLAGDLHRPRGAGGCVSL